MALAGDRLVPDEVAALVHQFWPREAVLPAIAVCYGESNGYTKATNLVAPDQSYGLWQINMREPMGTERRRYYEFESNTDLFDPVLNAQVAYDMWRSNGWRPWGAYTNGSYRRHWTKAEYGEHYYHMTKPHIRCLVEHMQSQAGDPYVFGAEVSKSDPDPDRWDCSEIIEWAAARCGVTLPDGSSNQIQFCVQHGYGIPIEQAIRTYGAVLFRRGDINHIAVSLGNGKTIEARGHNYGVGSFSAYDRGWTAAAKIPGFDYTTGDWFDMATKDELKAALRELFDEGVITWALVNDVISNDGPGNRGGKPGASSIKDFLLGLWRKHAT